jgi:hypothetical protein
MPAYLTPGVYFERPRPQGSPLPQRTDVAGFVGIAERGPLHQPLRLTTWREFQEVFGGFLPYAALAYGVHAFFQNGGRACWVVRVADRRRAVSAKLTVPDSAATSLPTDELPEASFAYRIEASTPGTWGNQLAVSVQATVSAATQHVVVGDLPAGQIAVDSIAGFARGSLIGLIQRLAGKFVQRLAWVTEVDVIGRILHFELYDDGEPEPRLDKSDSEAAAISVESLEFALLVWQADQIAERFDKLSPHPIHSRYAVNVVNAGSRLIRIERGNGGPLPLLPWRGTLAGGTNGLRSLRLADYVGGSQDDDLGLTALARIDEISLLVMPDLTFRAPKPEGFVRASRPPLRQCATGVPPTVVRVRGRVIETVSNDEAGDAVQPLPEVQIDDGVKRENPIVTGEDGIFVLDAIPPGPYDLVLNLDGYKTRGFAFTAVAGEGGEQDLEDIPLSPCEFPPPLSQEAIFAGQQAVVAQCETLRDRFAILDPPLDRQGRLLDTSDIQGWRTRFDTAFAAFYYPWLVVPDPLQPAALAGRLLPPSGHVAGIYAGTDLAEGVFRPPANKVLTFVEDVATVIDDALQGTLNSQGINAIRPFPGRGIRIYGARTLTRDTAWRYVNVRRLMCMLQETMYDKLQWAVFEPNDRSLWSGLRLALTTLLDGLWRRGAFAGQTAEAAYQVRCDASTTPPELQAEGRVIAEVAVAPTVPYEFIVLRLGKTTDELTISEV